MVNKINLHQNKQKLIIFIILTVLTLSVYWQVHRYDFINYDDPVYITENHQVQSGITTDGFRWAFTTKYFGLWNPLVWLSFMVDHQLYGLKAGGYHVTNLILHLLSTLLLFWLFHRMTGAVWRSAFVAAFFALHPLHVESVAWVSERKDVLSAFFWMLTLCFYVYYTEKPAIKRYLFVLFSFVMAAMSKPIVVTLPVIMILLDYWPLRRFESRKGNLFLWQLKEKLPFFVLSAALVFVTLYKPENRDISRIPFSFSSRLANDPVAFMIYLEKTFWPNDLTIFYPFPTHILVWQILGASLLIILITTFIILMAKRLPYLFTGWFWFVIALLPVMGAIHGSFYSMADRYHYLPSIGISIMLAWGVPFFFRSENIRRKILFPAAIVFLAFLIFLTWKQCGYWENNFKLWNHALKVTKDNFMAYGNLGVAMLADRRTKEAIEHFDKALLLRPDYPLLYVNRGGAYAELGQYVSAIEDFNKAVLLNPNYAVSYKCRGYFYYKIHQYQNAIKDFDSSIRLRPFDANTYNYRGIAFANLGRYELAIRDFNRAVALNNDYSEAYINMAAIYGKFNQYDNVIKNLSEVIRLQPENALIYFNRGFTYAKIGQYQSAIQDLNEAILRKENYADAYNIRAAAYLNQRNFMDGCRDAKKACELGNCSTLQVAANKGSCR